MEDFYTAVEWAKKIEKGALPQMNFSNPIEIVKTIDLEPREVEDMTFSDLINLYERSQKVISATKVFEMQPSEGSASTAPIVSIQKEQKQEEVFDTEIILEKQSERKTQEVESKVRAITSESLQKAEELSKEFEKPIEVPVEGMKKDEKGKPLDNLVSLELDFERHDYVPQAVAERKIMHEEEMSKNNEKPVEMEIEKEITPNITEEPGGHEPAKLAKPIAEKPVIKTPLPSILRDTQADEAAQAKYSEIETYLTQEWGGAVDEGRIKKKMLDLTKELFREKTTGRREKIKLEIVVLKNMLNQIKRGGVRKTSTKEVPKATHSQNVYETILSTEKAEISTAKDTIQSEFSEKISTLKHAYFDKIREANDNAEKIKEAYDTLEKGLSILQERVERLIEKTKEFMVQKHGLELKNARESTGNTKMAKEIQKQEEQLKEIYAPEFDHLKEMMIKRIESFRDTAAQTAVPSSSEQKQEQIPPVVYEINETDEGTLLYYLHSKDSNYYKKYERHHISRTEALDYAKIMMAKEKGLSVRAITKYFGIVADEKDT